VELVIVFLIRRQLGIGVSGVDKPLGVSAVVWRRPFSISNDGDIVE
jgi:hypothetical protein